MPRDFQLRAYLSRQLSNSDGTGNGKGGRTHAHAGRGDACSEREEGFTLSPTDNTTGDSLGRNSSGRFTAGLRRASSFTVRSSAVNGSSSSSGGDGGRRMRRWSSLSSPSRAGRRGVVGVETLEREGERR